VENHDVISFIRFVRGRQINIRKILEVIAENSYIAFATVFTFFLKGVSTTKADVVIAEFCGFS
jgi:hypothetical protein